MQLAGLNGAECANQPTKLVSPAWGVGAQQASLETWQPGSSQFLRWWDGISPEIQPLLQLHRPVCLSVTPHISIAQALRDACRTRGEHVIL